MQLYLLFSIFLIANCGIVYELLAGTISSYLVGDSVYQFSLVIGIFMSSMGLGSYLSRFINKKLPDWFTLVELLTGVIGGLSPIVLFFSFAYIENYTPVLFLVSVVIGTLIGLEIPIILRILKEHTTLKLLVSNVMTADYIGGLFASLLFPIVLVPQLGLIRTGLLFGFMNVAVAAGAIYVFRDKLEAKRGLITASATAVILIATCFLYSDKITTFAEDVLYKDEIIFSAQTPYQRVIVTKTNSDFRMYINGSIQFSSQDEYRYHESLIHPAMAAAPAHENILIIGGGDGLAAREILKYHDVASLTVVDIDPAITNFAKNNKMMRDLNNDSFRSPKTTIYNADAWKFLEETKQIYDVIFIDLPDPDNLTLSRLYSKTFYRLLAQRLSRRGIIVTQSTSPLYSHKAFWCIYNTFKAVKNPYLKSDLTNASASLNLHAQAYHTYVPSFGEWGFVMASPGPIFWDRLEVKVPTRFVTTDYLKAMGNFPQDMDHVVTEVNSIDTHKVKAYYEEGWDLWTL